MLFNSNCDISFVSPDVNVTQSKTRGFTSDCWIWDENCLGFFFLPKDLARSANQISKKFTRECLGYALNVLLSSRKIINIKMYNLSVKNNEKVENTIDGDTFVMYPARQNRLIFVSTIEVQRVY